MSSRLRPGNAPLQFLLSRCSAQSVKLEAAIDLLPQLARELYRDSQTAAYGLLPSHGKRPLLALGRAVATAIGIRTKSNELADCIFDLKLTVLFIELTSFFNDNVIASAFVDAVLYQATGCLPASPTDEQVLCAGTHRVRGIHKFWRAPELMPGVRNMDSMAWVFGVEYSAIVSGNPNDMAYIICTAPIAARLRIEAKFCIRHVLYGEVPSPSAISDADAMESNMWTVIDELAHTIGSPKPNLLNSIPS